MENHHSSSYTLREQGFRLSYKLAREQLSEISDIEEQCRKSGAKYLGPCEIVINYLNQPYRVMLPEGKIMLEDSNIEAPLKDKILILHYFIGSKGTPATGKLITYKQIPGGMNYFPAFSHRTIATLVNHFGRNPKLLINAAARLGGREAKHGDVSVTINAFDHVPITFVLWKGDEELSPNGNILFDANISDYLPTEDIAVLSEAIIWKMVKDSHST